MAGDRRTVAGSLFPTEETSAMTDPPGWAQPGREPDRPTGWAPEQPPPAPGGWLPPHGWGPAPTPKPGVIPLRPLGVGELLDGAISTMRANPWPMLGLSAVVALVAQLVQVPIVWLLMRDVGPLAPTSAPATPAQQASLLASTLSTTAITVLVTAVANVLLTGILTVVVSRAVLGEHVSSGQAWGRARPRLPALFGVTVLVVLALAGLAALALAPGVLLAVADAPAASVAVAFLLGVPLAVVATGYLYVAWALAPPAVVLERQPVLAALSRSRALVRGAWWRTFGVLVLLNIIAGVIGQILAIPFFIASLAAGYVVGGQPEPYGFWPLVVTGVGTVVAAAVTWPFVAGATALLYVDRRIRREGLDLELARAAGVPLPATPGAGQPFPPGGPPPRG